MPIIEIQALRPAEGVDVPQALARVTTTVAAHLGEDPRGTWALWRPLEDGAYAEGANTPTAQPADTHPAIVDLFAQEREGLEELMKIVGRAVARYNPARPDRVSWGD